MINRDSDSPHRDFAYPPLIIVELETNTHCRPVLASPQHIKQMQEAGPQKKTLDSTEIEICFACGYVCGDLQFCHSSNCNQSKI